MSRFYRKKLDRVPVMELRNGLQIFKGGSNFTKDELMARFMVDKFSLISSSFYWLERLGEIIEDDKKEGSYRYVGS